MCLVKMIARKYEIKKQVTGEDAEHEKSGRILNRVIKWERGEITVEADPNVRETHKAFLPKQANFVVTPCGDPLWEGEVART